MSGRVDLERRPFGKAMRELFPYDPTYLPINHGCFGIAPIHLNDLNQRLRVELDRRPEEYLRYKYSQALIEARKATAKLLNAELDDTVILSNATTGYNTILRNIDWQIGDYIVYYDVAYGSLRKLITYLAETLPVQGYCLPIQFPRSDDDIVAAFEQAFCDINARPGCRVRLAAFDTVASMPAMRMPYERLVEACRSAGVLSLVDGAHGIGMIPFDLTALDADFFISNMHKWLFVPRACAVLNVPKRNRTLIRTTLPTGHAFRARGNEKARNFWPTTSPPFAEMFEMIGTVDSQNFLLAPAAIDWRARVCGGENAIQEYSNDIAHRGAERVAEILGTEVMDAAGSRLRDCAMANVRLPIDVASLSESDDGDDGTKEVIVKPGQVDPRDVMALMEWFIHYSSVASDSYFQVIPYHGTFWVRLSGQIYLDMNDFEQVGVRLRQICDKIRDGGRDLYIKDDWCRLCAEAYKQENATE